MTELFIWSKTVTSYNLRWRVVGGKIPLLRRHYCALEPLDLPAPLMAWIHERLEWAADNMLYQDSGAVICLAIDPAKDIVVSLEDLRPTPELSLANITAQNGTITGICYQDQALQGTVWVEKDDTLLAALAPDATELTTATDSFALQLADTLKYSTHVGQLALSALDLADSVFVISDEFGFIPIKSSLDPSSKAAKLADCFNKLFDPEPVPS